MPFVGSAPNKTFQRTDGTRTGSAVNVTADGAGISNTAQLADNRENDIAAALTTSWQVNGNNQPSANLPMNSKKFTGMAQGSARTDSLRIDQIQDGDLIYASVGGTADAIELTLTPAVTALVEGMMVIFIPSGDNTTAVTIDTNSIGAIALEYNSTALSGGELQGGQPAIIVHDGTNWQLANPFDADADTAKLDVAQTWTAAQTLPNTGLHLLDTGGDHDYIIAPGEDATADRTLTLDLGDSDRTLTLNGNITPLGQGLHTIVIPASAMLRAITNGPGLAQIEESTNKQNYKVLDFDASTDEYAHFNITMPKSWNEGTITFQVTWSTEATDTDGVAWGLQAVALSDNEAIDASWGTAVVVTDDAQGAANEALVTSVSSAVTIAGTPAEGDIVFFRIFRDVSDANDDMTEDARLISVKIFFTINAATDA